MRFWCVQNVKCAFENGSMNKCRKTTFRMGSHIRVDELKSDTDLGIAMVFVANVTWSNRKTGVRCDTWYESQNVRGSTLPRWLACESINGFLNSWYLGTDQYASRLAFFTAVFTYLWSTGTQIDGFCISYIQQRGVLSNYCVALCPWSVLTSF